MGIIEVLHELQLELALITECVEADERAIALGHIAKVCRVVDALHYEFDNMGNSSAAIYDALYRE